MRKRLWKVTGIFEGMDVEMAVIAGVWTGRQIVKRFAVDSMLEEVDTDPMLDGSHFDLDSFDTITYNGETFYIKDWADIKKTFKDSKLMGEGEME